MGPDEILSIIKKIRLEGGHVHAGEIFPGVIQIDVSVTRKDRETGQLTDILLSERYPHKLLPTEKVVLREVQVMWTTLWMHESLETFWYQDDLVFNPHCNGHREAKVGHFGGDGTCQPLRKFRRNIAAEIRAEMQLADLYKPRFE